MTQAIVLTRRAAEQVSALVAHYAALGRTEAVANLRRAIETGRAGIAASPESGLPAPRPYPGLARDGRARIKSGRYWISYTLASPPVIVAVFHDASDMPGRVGP